MKSSLDKIFYKIVYYHIIYMCDFFGEFRQLFAIVCMIFTKLWFPPYVLYQLWTPNKWPCIVKILLKLVTQKPNMGVV